MAYQITEWLDEADQYEDIFIEQTSDVAPNAVKHTKYRGTVEQIGTSQNAANFNNMEGGIFDAHTAMDLMVNAHRQSQWRIEALEKATAQETGEVTLNNTQEFPFNDSQVSIPLTVRRDNLNYVVEVISVAPTGGPSGEIEVSDRQVNGFKMAFTGSATKCVVKYAVIGGFD